MCLSFYPYFILLYCTSSLLGCGNPLPEQVSSRDTLRPEKVSVKFDTLQLTGWGRALKNGGKFTASFLWKDSSYLVASGCSDSALHILNLDDTTSMRSVPFPHGYDLCNFLACSYFSSPDRFFLVMRGKNIMRYDRGIWSSAADPKVILAKDELSIREMVGGNEMFVQGDSLALVPVKQYMDDVVNINYNGKSPETAEINLHSGKVNYTGISYPVELNLGRYSLLRGMYQAFYNGKIFYFFEAIPEVWEYNPGTGVLTRHPVRSQYQQEEIRPMEEKDFYDKDEWIKHRRESGTYDKFLLYDPYRKWYYRFFTLPLAEKNSDGFFNTYRDTRVSLMVLNENMEVISESLLPKKCFFIFYTAVSKSGLYINNGAVINPEKNGFPLLKISFPGH